MKRKNLAWLILITMSVMSALLPGCDMVYVNGPDEYRSGETGGTENPDLAYLSITSLPTYVQKYNITNVFVWNQAGRIGECADYSQIVIIPSETAATLKIPLWYSETEETFGETGSYFVSFDLNVDALSRFKITEKEKITAFFLNGSGTLDITALPQPGTGSDPDAPHDLTYLEITELPPHAQKYNITNVYVWNQAGRIGECMDYSLVSVSSSGTTATLKVPLWYMATGEKFEETGNYFISFDINVDALTRFKITEKEQITAFFLNGSGTFDASTLPQPPQPETARYFTVTGLPPNTPKNGFSGVYLSNAAGRVAKCSGYGDIIITPNGLTAAASIPMVYVNDASEPFRNTGTFIIEFSVDIDAYTQIYISNELSFTSDFTDGAGTFDIMDFLGYFNGSLTNPADTFVPVVRQKTKFEMNGSLYELASAEVLPSLSLDKTSLVYVYAVPVPGGVSFEYSTETPAFSTVKNGYYRGNSRALFKFIYLKGSGQYIAKAFISDPWEHFGYTPISTYAIAAENLEQAYVLSGSGNPAPQTRTFQPGAYIVGLSGAGGGGSAGHAGGTGGFLSELVFFSKPTTLTLYAGGGGGGASEYCGGGGGSGTFIYSPDGYLAVAGGGGGAGGRKIFFNLTNDAYGGAGGSVGPGGRGTEDWQSGRGAGGGASCSIVGNASGYAYSSSCYALYSSYAYPDDWKNSNGANGQGGDRESNGGDGGNNRDSSRGGGTVGSSGNAGAGSLAVFKVAAFPF
jgi:hypothetical protein